MIDPRPEAQEELAKLTRVLEGAVPEGEGATAERVTLDVEYRPADLAPGEPEENRHATVELPRAAVAALLEITRALAQGQRVELVPRDAMLTTQQAADLLDVSRPHVIALTERGELPCEWAGSHRRLSSADVLAYRERRAAARRSAAREIQIMSAEAEGGY